MTKECFYALSGLLNRIHALLFISMVAMVLLSCETSSVTPSANSSQEQPTAQTESLNNNTSFQGSYCAEVYYSNSNTGTNSQYSLLVDVKDNQVICIHWPQGGQLDTDHFTPNPISKDSISQIQTFEGKQYRVKILGPESVCNEMFQGQLQQCKGTTKEGKRCKRMTDNENGYCFQHGGR